MSSLHKFVLAPARALRRSLIALRQLPDVWGRLEDLSVSVEQLGALVDELGCAPLPPRELQIRVVGSYVGEFLQSGHQAVADMERVLGRHALTLSAFQSILDFGCGCGRVLRCLPLQRDGKQHAQGTDIDTEAISWCQIHYNRYARFTLNSPAPPLDFPDDCFDFIYSISIFTHLPEEMQFAWLRELQRVVKPGGYVLLSYHGESRFADIPGGEQTRMARDGFVYAKTGRTRGLPEFYQTAWHASEYVGQRWGEFFDVIDIVPVAIGGRQDAALCRKRVALSRSPIPHDTLPNRPAR
jgi:SAM-dependent methyltransferase